jgi:hypothetical protein
MSIIGLHEASVILGLPAFLIRDFVSYEFNGRKLFEAAESHEFDLFEVRSFQKHIDAPWPGEDRRDPPDYVKRYLVYEAGGLCALCRQDKPNYEYAHIRGWASSRCNNPHNMLRLYLDCHRSHGTDAELLRGVKEEHLRRIQLVDQSLLYECAQDTVPGDAVYVLDGRVLKAHAGAGRDCLAVGFAQTKIGIDRCTVQRLGVVVSIDGLEAGQEYCLSPTEPGRIVTRAVFDETRDMSKDSRVQFVGWAESNTDLAIGSLGFDLVIHPGVRIGPSAS